MFVRQLTIAFVVLSTASYAMAQMYPGVPYDGGYGGRGDGSFYQNSSYDTGSSCGCGSCGGGDCGGMPSYGAPSSGMPSYGMPGNGIRANSFGGLVRGSMAGIQGMAPRPIQNWMTSPAGPAQANALFGWARPGDCAGCGNNGYHPDAAAYPQMMGGGPMAQQPGGFPGMEGGYQDMGGTCCGPHWFDFMIEGVLMGRAGDTDLGLMSQGIRGLAPPNIVQGSDDIHFDVGAGFRAAVHWQLNAVNFIEGIYLGGLDWNDTSVVTSTNHDLYSRFSDFGNLPFGGFEDSDQATTSALSYDSELDSMEVNWRRGWISPDNKFSGTWLIGGRYIRLQDTLQHQISVTPHFDPISLINRADEFTLYDINVENDMAGVQVGTELVRCLSPGLLVGAEGKIMAFANRISQRAQIQSTTLQPPRVENDDDTDFSWGTEARVFSIWQFHPWMKFRLGYEFLFLNEAATAFGNYNDTPFAITPFVSDVRTISVTSDESLFFHGLTLGFELGW